MNSIDEWNNYWKKENQTDSVYGDAEGKLFQSISSFWRKTFADFPKSASIIDICCGTGAVFDAIKHDTFVLSGMDCSDVALKRFKKKNPNAITIKSESITESILVTNDILVSQFGIEYLGKNHLIDLFGRMAHGTSLIALCHYKGGHIYNRYLREADAIRLLRHNDLFAITKELFHGVFTCNENHPKLFSRLLSVFEQYRQSWKAGSAHYVQGVCDLYQNRNNYYHSDINDWIDGIENQLLDAEKRMDIVCNVALDNKFINELSHSVEGRGKFFAVPFFTSGVETPIAWQMHFEKR